MFADAALFNELADFAEQIVTHSPSYTRICVDIKPTPIRGGALLRECYSIGMNYDGWLDRFWAAVHAHMKATGRSPRDISLKAGQGENYLEQLKKRGNAPRIDGAIAICEEIGVSFFKVLTDLDIDGDGQELLEIAGRMSPARRQALLAAFRPEEDGGREKAPQS